LLPFIKQIVIDEKQKAIRSGWLFKNVSFSF